MTCPTLPGGVGFVPISSLLCSACCLCTNSFVLHAALQEKRIKGAALDVCEVEPLPEDSPLWALDNVLLSPHCADRTADFQVCSEGCRLHSAIPAKMTNTLQRAQYAGVLCTGTSDTPVLCSSRLWSNF